MLRDRADVDFDGRRQFLTDDWLHRLSEHVVQRELEGLHGDVFVFRTQLLVPQFRELVFRQKRVEQSLDRLGGVVARTLLAAAEFS